jgi:hypothetical protein
VITQTKATRPTRMITKSPVLEGRSFAVEGRGWAVGGKAAGAAGGILDGDCGSGVETTGGNSKERLT